MISVTSPSTGYQANDAAAMLALASVAETDLTDLYLQPPWQVIETFQTSSTAGGPQGFVAVGPLPSSGVKAAIVGIGFSWPDFIELYQQNQHTLSLPPAGLLAAKEFGIAQTDLGYTTFYAGIRKQIWASILFAKQTVPDFQTVMPLIVTGHGPAAPLAQLAALDLLPGHTWRSQTSPATSLSAYVYSCPAFGNKEFADYYAQVAAAG